MEGVKGGTGCLRRLWLVVLERFQMLSDENKMPKKMDIMELGYIGFRSGVPMMKHFFSVRLGYLTTYTLEGLEVNLPCVTAFSQSRIDCRCYI